MVGLEPTRLSALVPKTSVAAISPHARNWWMRPDSNGQVLLAMELQSIGVPDFPTHPKLFRFIALFEKR